MTQKLDQVAIAGDVPAEGADGLRQRPDLYVHAPVHAEVIDRAAAVLSKDAAGMRVVNHHDAAGALGKVAQRRKRAEIAVHTEDAISNEQLALSRGQSVDDAACGVHVLVGENLDRGTAE